MKKMRIILLLLAMTGCTSSDINTDKTPVRHYEEDTGKEPINNIASSKPAPIYDGDGGKGIILAILSPDGKDLPKTDEWIPAYIQGTLTTIFNRFSNMTVLDRQNLEKIIDEQTLAASGYYSDEDYISIGNLTNAQYILIGNVLNISNNEYSLQLSISEPERGIRKASFIKNCTAIELKNAAVLKDASYDLLAQMGVQLTEAGIKQLYEIEDYFVNAETSLARGIVAENNGTIIKALNYYYDARDFNPSLPEAANRINNLAANISNGNIGVAVRNDIQRRNSWKKLLDECDVFYNENPPFEIVYDPALSQGPTDYEKQNVALSFFLKVVPSDKFKVINDIYDGLTKTGKKTEWGFDAWPFSEGSGIYSRSVMSEYNRLDYYGAGEYIYTSYNDILVRIELLNDQEKTIGKANIKVELEVGKTTRTVKSRYEDVGVYNPIINPKPIVCEVFINDISADDITDNLTLRISAVNGNINAFHGEVKNPLAGYYIYGRPRR
ncbi:MAG: hypothetical protein LBF78_12540 [Treponema sp.]|jgi:hypothetical protein|nr:hypothetical protein [Treponema sp.]